MCANNNKRQFLPELKHGVSLPKTTMNEETPFTRLAKEIRERTGMKPKEFAEKSDSSEATIYHIEKGRRCNISRLRKTYRPFCKDEQEFTKLLVLAAIQNDDNNLSPEEVMKVADDILTEEEAAYYTDIDTFRMVVSSLDHESKESLMRFLKLIPNSPPLRQMIRAFVSE